MTENAKKEDRPLVSAGIDILEQGDFYRLVNLYGERFLGKILTKGEIEHMPSNDRELYYCITFSFKEAIWKALPDTLQKRRSRKSIEIIWAEDSPLFPCLGKGVEGTLDFSVAGTLVITTAVLTLR